MKKVLIVNIVLFLCGFAAYANDGYKYTLDLTKVNDDKVYVELETPSIKEKEINFNFAKMIPGTYAIEDYGRFVSDFKALDKKGRELEVEPQGDNVWLIKKANKLVKITYWIEDSYDTQLEGPDIFQPAGTNIEDGKNFVINSSGYFGYFEGKKDLPYELHVVRPDGFYGATGLIPSATNEAQDELRLDKFTTSSYDELVDSPIMYSKADTAFVKVGNTDVLIGSYSPNSKVSAKEIAASIKEVLMAQKEYLGGKLPVDKYAFIFYFTDQPVTSYGALEHSYSSFYYMPEMSINQMAQQLRDFAAHEFFHIVTPLTIHSHEIGEFNFTNPEMSKHLWMYEGVTEYFAGNMQVKYGLISLDEYLQVLREKMITASQFIDSVAFTTISKGTLDKYEDQYYNVYQKGALIGMALDIQLRELSEGKYGMQNLMIDLSKKFGKDKSFDDDELFSVITELTYPEIGEFLDTYVGGNESLPFEELFNKVGIDFEFEKIVETVSLGLQQANIAIAPYNGAQHLAIQNAENLNPMGDSLGFENGDVLVAINGKDIPPLGPELGSFIGGIQESLKVGETLSYSVMRKDEAGEWVKEELAAKIFPIEQPQIYVLEFAEDATDEQLQLRKWWLQPQE